MQKADADRWLRAYPKAIGCEARCCHESRSHGWRGAVACLPQVAQNLDVSLRSTHADPLPIPDQVRSMLHPDDGRQAELACDHGAVGHQAPDLRHQAFDREEQECPAGIGGGGDEDVVGLDVGLGDVSDDAGAPFDGPGGNR